MVNLSLAKLNGNGTVSLMVMVNFLLPKNICISVNIVRFVDVDVDVDARIMHHASYHKP